MARNKKKKGAKILIPVPEVDMPKGTKFRIGDQSGPFTEIKTRKPVFAFDYVSLNQSEICFDSQLISLNDFHRLFGKLKDISSKTYDELRRNTYFRFHEVDLDDERVSLKKSDLKRALSPNPQNVDDDHLPTLYQLDLFEEARACGFLFKGVFYLIWFDRNHRIYPRR